VVEARFPNEVIQSVIRELKSIPDDVASWREEEGREEYRVIVEPKDEDRCKFWLGFGTYGTYGLCFGHGLAFEDLRVDEFPPAQVVQSILAGRVSESVWEIAGGIAKAQGRITMGDGRQLEDIAWHFPALPPFAKRRDISYRAYSQKA